MARTPLLTYLALKDPQALLLLTYRVYKGLQALLLLTYQA